MQLPVLLWLKVGELRLVGKIGTLEVVTVGFRGSKLG